MSTPSFLDKNYYYRVTNEILRFERAIGTDYQDGIVSMTNSSLNSTGNAWQFFPQSGVFFIRNYLFKQDRNLAFRSTKSTIPKMLNATTGLNEQWLVQPWDDQANAYKIINVMMKQQTNASYLLGVDTQTYNLALVSDESEARWYFQNETYIGHVDNDMLIPYSFVETPTTTPSATGGSSTATSTNSVSAVGAGHSSFNGLDKAGVAVGIIVAFALLLVAFFGYRRYKKYGRLSWHARADGPTDPAVARGQPEVVKESPPAYNNRHSQSNSTTGIVPSYYNASRTMPKQADEESIELPSYGKSPVEPKYMV